MPFLYDPFKQAEAEVANKSMGSQIAHSSLFHSMRSAFSSSGSGLSKGAGVALGVGKLFLALIPVPIVGAVIGAAADAINSQVRGARHAANLKAAANTEEKVKFEIKELTVENLDRYRWKVKHAIEEMNLGITAYNASAQTCDDMYSFALLYKQFERRRNKLKSELDKFQEVTDLVTKWMAEVDATQALECKRAVDAINAKTKTEIAEIARIDDTSPMWINRAIYYKNTHANCKQWCYFKEDVKYKPSDNWLKFKERSGKVAGFLAPIAVASVAVRQSDYTSSADNSKFTS